MAVSVLVFDKRLESRSPLPPHTFTTLEVDESTPLDYFLNRCKEVAEQQGGISTLYIMAHGAEAGFTAEIDGGYRLLFCQEELNLDTVQRFSILAGHVEHIIMLVFAVPATSWDIYNVDIDLSALSSTFHSDGNELARQIAVHAKTKVAVAKETQRFSAEDYQSSFAGYEVRADSGDVDFGDWEGMSVQFNAKGDMTEQWSFPSLWRDKKGAVQDPRLETE